MNTANSTSTSFLLAGVGGQGTILASDVLADVGIRLGYQAKKAEVHGMSQRGGSVISHVRWGTQVFSPVIAAGQADILVAFEQLEAMRFAHHLRPGGLAVVNRHTIVPVTVSAGQAAYPDEAAIHNAVARITGNICWVNGIQLAEQAGNARTANVVMLGALSARLKQEAAPWLAAIEARVPPKYAGLNRRAFLAGREAVTIPA